MEKNQQLRHVLPHFACRTSPKRLPLFFQNSVGNLTCGCCSLPTSLQLDGKKLMMLLLACAAPLKGMCIDTGSPDSQALRALGGASTM